MFKGSLECEGPFDCGRRVMYRASRADEAMGKSMGDLLQSVLIYL